MVILLASSVLGVQVTVPLYCDGGYMWYAGVGVGTPSRRYNFTVDTGSSDFLLVGTDCAYDSCGVPPSIQYNASASNTAKRLTCADAAAMGLSCASCHGSGAFCASSVDYGGNILEQFTLVQDAARPALQDVGIGATTILGDTYNVNMSSSSTTTSVPRAYLNWRRAQRRAAAAHPRRVGQGAPDPSGMWGLASVELVNSRYPPFFDRLVAASNGALADMFAVAMTADGGAMTLGGSIRSQTAFAFVPRAMPADFYRVEITDVAVGGSSLGLPSSTYNDPGIVDTGTPTVTLPTAAFNQLVGLINARCSSNNTSLHGVCDVPGNQSVLAGYCYDYTASEVAAFPTISFKLPASAVAAVSLEYRPEAYLVPQYFCASPTQRSFALQADPRFTVLGASMLQQYEVLFDREAQRVGFAATPL